MRIPAKNQGEYWSWVSKPSNETLLYFVQLMDELIDFKSSDNLRVVSLDSYHRLREVERTWAEASSSDIKLNTGMMFSELKHFLSRDPIVTSDFQNEWLAVQPRFNSAADNPEKAVDAVRFLALKISSNYLRKCRDYLEKAVVHGCTRNRREFRLVTENFCSYLLNTGFHPESISFRIQRSFFERDLEYPLDRELKNFFSYFPHDSKHSFRVGVIVSSDLAELLSSRGEFNRVTRQSWAEGWLAAADACNQVRNPFFSWDTSALDLVDARYLCEAHLSQIRAVAYTAKPYADLNWDPYVIVGSLGGRATILREGSVLLKWGRGRKVSGPRDSKLRFDLFLDRPWSEVDRNRLINALTTYASAFHSESSSSQLVALWSSLEGLLPTPRGSGSRIASFSRDTVACLERLSLHRQFSTLHDDLNSAYRQNYLTVLNRVNFSKSDHVDRLAAIFCLREHKDLRTEIGNLCSENPLARQRLFEIYNCCDRVSKLATMLQERANKTEWQLHRIYRERNRIVHRASPSANVGTLIQTLNFYLLGVFDALLSVGMRADRAAGVDDLFGEILIEHEARGRWAADNAQNQIDESRLLKFLGRKS